MSKRLCVCSLIVGGLLVLLAALVVVATPSGSALSTMQRLRLERIVSATDGCATCHDAPVQTGDGSAMTVALVIEYAHMANLPAADLRNAPSRTTAPRVPAAVQADIHAIGRRILTLAEYPSLPLEPVAADFLAVYDTLRTADSAETVAEALDKLAQIDDLLRTFEGQTQPLKWNVPAASDQSPDVMAAVPVSQVAPFSAAWSDHLPVVLAREQRCGRAMIDATSEMVPVVVTDVQRRGPPAGFDNRIVLGGRLPFVLIMDVQSSLFFAAFG